LIAKLAEEPFAHDFYAAVRRLQSHFSSLPRIGHSRKLNEDPLRFAQNPGLEFAPSTLEKLERKDPARPPVLYSRHFGLFGPNGPLPLCLTEYALERMTLPGTRRDPTFVAFCNVFHHRLLSFFFRAWADAQKTVDFDRPSDQHWAQFFGSLVGLGVESRVESKGVPDRATLYFSGRLVQRTRNADGLEAIVQDFFGIPTRLNTFVGRWLNLPPVSCCKLGATRESGILGATVIIGSRFWTCQLHFRLRMGPMKLAEYERMLPADERPLPAGASFRRLCDWVRFFTSEQYSWDVQLVLAKEEVPATQMGKAGRLGRTTWLKTMPFKHDADDLVLAPPA
jgi:type VI secretion system protein ImpH